MGHNPQPTRIFDLFFKQVWMCNSCGAYRLKKGQMRKHVKSFHGDAIKAVIAKEVEA